MRSKVSRNFVLLAPPSCGEVSANKSANVGALIFIVTLFGSVLIIAYHPPFVQRFLSTFNLPVNFDGGLSWYRSYFSDYDDKQIINYLKYQQLKKKQISSKRLNKKQKDLITYFCEAPHFEALLTKGYRFQCVLEDMEKKILRSFPITKQDCQ